MELELQDAENFFSASAAIFGKPFNEPLIHQVVISYLSRKRQGTKSQKSKAEVSGSGRKPWKQKGTGRARVGSLRSPIWRSGGVTFAAKPRNYSCKINKKMYKGAIQSIFSELIRQNRILIFNKFDIESYQTKILIKKLNSINIDDALIVLDHVTNNMLLSSRNLHKITVLNVCSINPVSLISHKNIIITVAAMRIIEGIFS